MNAFNFMRRIAAFTSGFGLFFLLMPLGIVFGGFWAWLPIIATFVNVPLLDMAGGVSLWNPAPEAETALSADPRFRSIVGLWVPVAIALTVAWPSPFTPRHRASTASDSFFRSAS